MGNERWIVNASPLILLWKADYLYLLPELADVICVPKTVKLEIQAKDEGAPIVQALQGDTKFSIIEGATNFRTLFVRAIPQVAFFGVAAGIWIISFGTMAQL